MREEIATLVSGRRRGDADSSYVFSVFIIDNKLCFSEEYDYYARDDDPGRSYVYGLSMSLSHLDAFIALLLKRSGSEPPVPQTDKNTLLRTLFKQLASQGAFKDAEVAAIKENLAIIQTWLVEEDIPHTPPYLAF